MSTASDIATLQAQLATLQAQVNALTSGSVDQLTPNYITVEPDGEISANFSGFVDATGIQLPTLLGSPSEALSDVIRWQNPNTGKFDGGVYAQYLAGSPNSASITVAGQTENAAETSGAQIEAFDDTRTRQGVIWIQQTARGNNVFAGATAGTKEVGIIDNAGNSSFLQLTGFENAKIIFGTLPGALTMAGNPDPQGLLFPPSWFGLTQLFWGIANAWPASTWTGFQMITSLANPTLSGPGLGISFLNETEQNADLSYCAIGN